MNEAEARFALGRIFALRLPRSWDDLDLRRFPVANYIIFRDDLEATFEASRGRLRAARTHLQGNGIKPLFMVDEEGGRVSQVSSFFPPAPSPRSIARALTPDMTESLYAHVSAQLAALGIHVNLFPCLDVNTEPLNPIIGTRSYGDTPEQVTAYARAAIRGSRRFVACVGKHFPGHGMTRTDSHRELPIVMDSHARLDYMHIYPFKAAMAAGLDGIMVSHCLYMSLQDDGLPACLSAEIVVNQLRLRAGFNGLVLTDSLDMSAIADRVDPARAGFMAFEAGCDMLLYTEYSKRFERSFKSLLEAVLMGRIEIARVMESSRRRNKVVEHLKTLSPPSQPAEDDRYELLTGKVLARSFEIHDESQILPLSSDEVTVVTNSDEIVERLQASVPAITRTSEPSDAEGKVVIAWIPEPLVAAKCFGTLHKMVDVAGTSVLVTPYPALSRFLPDFDVTITVHDSTSRTHEAIIRTIFEKEEPR
jgi:beta-N-acetylhexosaminidase